MKDEEKKGMVCWNCPKIQNLSKLLSDQGKEDDNDGGK